MTTTTDRKLRYREAINEALMQEMERDQSIIRELYRKVTGRDDALPGLNRLRLCCPRRWLVRLT